MRQIEKAMLSAIADRRNWRKSNTEVQVYTQNDRFGNVEKCCNIYLFGNHIAIVTPTQLRISDAGFRTATTKSRLNVLLHAYTDHYGIYQKNFKWFIDTVHWNGHATIMRK